LEAFAADWKPAELHALEPGAPAASTTSSDVVRVEVNDKLFRVRMLDRPARSVAPRPGAVKPQPPRARSGASNGRAGNSVRAPMHGVVVEIPVAAGDSVAEGQVVAIVEAMKMMNEIRAHRAGSVASVHVAKGATVEAETELLTLE
jgi:biotin carboxyl carrier protein